MEIFLKDKNPGTEKKARFWFIPKIGLFLMTVGKRH